MHANELAIVFCLAAAAVGAWGVIQYRRAGPPASGEHANLSWELARGGRILTPAEWSVYERLTEALRGLQVPVFAKIALGYLLTLQETRGVENSAREAVRTSIGHLTVDFVVCNKAGEVLAIIDVNDASRSAHADMTAHRETVRQALRISNLNYLEWTLQDFPSGPKIKEAILKQSSPVSEALIVAPKAGRDLPVLD